MDTVATIFDLIRVRGVVYFGKIVRRSWSMEIDRHAEFWRFHLVLSGSTWVRLEDMPDEAHLGTGDFVIVPRGAAHILSDDRNGPATSCHSVPDREPAPEFETRRPKKDETQLLCGYFRLAQGTPSALLDQLPGLLIARGGEQPASEDIDAVIGLIHREMRKDGSVSTVVLNRLTEIMFYHAFRQWLNEAMLPDGALAALGDPNLQRALAEIHALPERAWTVDELARVAGYSRTAFSDHFRTATGYSPIRYLTRWRVELAQRLLVESSLSLDDIASRIGYRDTNSFSRAFSRINGISPAAYRRASRSQP